MSKLKGKRAHNLHLGQDPKRNQNRSHRAERIMIMINFTFSFKRSTANKLRTGSDISSVHLGSEQNHQRSKVPPSRIIFHLTLQLAQINFRIQSPRSLSLNKNLPSLKTRSQPASLKLRETQILHHAVDPYKTPNAKSQILSPWTISPCQTRSIRP